LRCARHDRRHRAYTPFFCRTATPASARSLWWDGALWPCSRVRVGPLESLRFFSLSLKLCTGQVHTHTSATSDSGSVRNTTQHVPDACLREESKCVSVMRATSRRGVVCLRCGVLLLLPSKQLSVLPLLCCVLRLLAKPVWLAVFSHTGFRIKASSSIRPILSSGGPPPRPFALLQPARPLRTQPTHPSRQPSGLTSVPWQQTVPVVRGFVRTGIYFTFAKPLVGGADAGSGPWARHCITNTRSCDTL
jgi:hypothetical protein